MKETATREPFACDDLMWPKELHAICPSVPKERSAWHNNNSKVMYDQLFFYAPHITKGLVFLEFKSTGIL